MGAIGQDGLAVPGKVQLAHEPAFKLGRVTVHPATRQLIRGKLQQSVEPRVMQVLVALVHAKGGIVTREDLTNRCWDGRIVGDDAINRSLSRIRGIANGIGECSFRIETIAKVGYRLFASDTDDGVVEQGQMSPVDSRFTAPGVDRRRLVVGAMAFGAAFLGGAAWWRNRPTADAAELYRKGVEARSLGLVESQDQATAYFRQAVRADPEFADAWGALASQVAVHFGDEGDPALARQSAEVRSAAGRALALDPDQADAQGALAVIQPYFRNWRRFEDGLLRVIRNHPGQRQATIELGIFYGNVARWDDAIARLRNVRREVALSPAGSSQLVLAYWAAGRLEEADAESSAALERWPRFHGMWFTRMLLLTYSGQPERAVAFAEDADHYPSGAAAEKGITLRRATARALVSRKATELAQVRDQLLANVKKDISNVPPAARFFSALGERDVVYELLDAYLYRRGRFATTGLKPIHPQSRITTDFLFYPTMSLLWDDVRFKSLTRDIGLDTYWRSVAFTPALRQP